MSDLVIENAPEETIRTLQQIAERTRRSVSEVALDFLPRPLDGLSDVKRGRTLVDRPLPDSTVMIRRDRDGVSDNELMADEAVALSRRMRATASAQVLPDSTIRPTF